MIDIDFARKSLDYDPESGIFTWRRRTDVGNWWNGRYSGRPAMNTPDKDGYLRGSFVGRDVKAHRLAWAMHYGEWPCGEIDHINGIRTDNRICNLRDSTVSQNRCNVGASRRNTSGYKGVDWNKERFMWRSRISKNRVVRCLGHFNCPTAAYFAYVKAAKELHGEFANTGMASK